MIDQEIWAWKNINCCIIWWHQNSAKEVFQVFHLKLTLQFSTKYFVTDQRIWTWKNIDLSNNLLASNFCKRQNIPNFPFRAYKIFQEISVTDQEISIWKNIHCPKIWWHRTSAAARDADSEFSTSGLLKIFHGVSYNWLRNLHPEKD